jgi:peptide/nickel transport system permease protein
MSALGLVLAPGVARVVRAATLPVREELYVAAARVSGLSRLHILGREILPRIAPVVIVQGALAAATALVLQSGLVVLGLIAPPSDSSLIPTQPTWGGLIADGIKSLFFDPWLIWPPGVVLVLTVIVITLSGDLLRDLVTETWSPPRQRAPLVRRGAARAPSAPLRGDALLSVEGLSIAFPSPAGPIPVVEDVSFSVQAGETVGVMGESGCGKTVTAMAILGLLPGGGEVTGGRIAFAGRNLAALSERALRGVRGTEIGLISQDPTVAFTPVYRVGWQVAEVVRRHHGVSAAAARERALDLLRRVHLPEPEVVAERLPHELSGGMVQRVALAAALAGEPKLLIADEPTTALDVTVQAEILELLRELQRDTGMAVLLITHDGGVIADSCDRVVVMYAGQVVERGDVDALFRQPLQPYTRALLESNPHRFASTERLPAIPGAVPEPGAWPAGCRFHPRCPLATNVCTEGPVALASVGERRETRCLRYEQLLDGGRAPAGRDGCTASHDAG